MKSKANPFLRNFLAATLAFAASTHHAQAANVIYQWNGTTDTNWATGTNWSATGGALTAGPGAFNTTSDSRLNVYNGAGQTLIYSADQGTTVYAATTSANNTAGRGLVVSFATGSVAGSMEITGGSFSTLGSAGADVIGNNATGILTVSGGSFIGSSAGTILGLNSSGGTSTLTVSGSGSATVSTLQMSAATAIVNLDGGTLTANQIVDLNDVGAVGNSNTTFNFNGGTLTAGSAAVTAFMTGLGNAYVLSDGAKIDTNGKDITISQPLLDFTTPSGGGLTLNDTAVTKGTLTLSGANTYTGATTVTAGTLIATSANNAFAPGSTLSVASGATFQANANNLWGGSSGAIGAWTIAGTFRVNGTTFAETMPTSVTLNGGTMSATGDYAVYGNFLNNGGTSIQANGTSNTISARIGMFSGITFDTPNSGDALAVSGILGATFGGGNSGTLTKSGAGTLTLTGVNTFAGATTVNEGVLQLGADSSSNPANGPLRNSSLLTISSGATVRAMGANAFKGYLNGNQDVTLNGGTLTMNDGTTLGGNHKLGTVTLNGGTISGVGNVTYGGFNLGGNVTVTDNSTISSTYTDTLNATRTITVSAGKTLNWTGTIYNGFAGNTTSLIFAGDGTTVLSNTNSYSGATTVDGGVLAVDGSTAAGSAVSVGGASASGTPTLSGIGTVNGTVSINAASGGAAGTINPGAVGAIGTLATGAATIKGTLAIDINAASSDQLVVNGNLDLTGATLSLNELAVPAATPYTIATYSGTLAGTFASAPSGYTVNYGSGTNDVITLTKSTSDYNTWGAPYGLTTGSENGDLDGDGLTNREEYAFGLIPNSGSSVNPVSSPLNKTNGKFSYTRRDPAKSDLTYSVWFSEDLVNWTQDTGATEGTSVPSGDNETVEVTLSALPGNPLPAKLFIQVRAN